MRISTFARVTGIALGCVLCAPPLAAQTDVNPQAKSSVSDALPPGDLETVDVNGGDDVPTGDENVSDLMDFSFDELSSARVTPDMNYEVTSVARDETSIARTPAAIFVVTNEMIRRSGARTIQDALRMVPGLHVSRQINGVWAIGMRGNAKANLGDMLVQVDGRSIYNRTFGGTYWGSQDFILEDIDRIEVIRGPGASVWGANAVRGVINIVTKDSSQTQGAYVEAVAGTEIRHSEVVRYGGKTAWGTYRLHGKIFDHDGGLLNSGTNDYGLWRKYNLGFRADLNQTWFDRLTVQGGILQAELANTSNLRQPTAPFQALQDNPGDSFAWYTNLIGDYEISQDESIKVRTSYYSLNFDAASLKVKPIDAVEFDFQHNLKPWDGHSVVWGVNFRNTTMHLEETFGIDLIGDRDIMANEYGLFGQDTIRMLPDVDLTVGAKLSYNDFSQFEHQPSGRIVWNPTPKLAVWTGVSRAVSIPDFSDVASQIRLAPTVVGPPTVFPRLDGNRNVHAEDLLAVEAGIRGQPTKDIYWDLAAYHFTIRDGRTVGPPSGLIPIPGFPGVFDTPLTTINQSGTAEVAGFEFFGRYNVDEDWQLSGNYSFAHNFDTGFQYPRNSLYLRSAHDLSDDLELDLIWRYRDNFGAAAAYNTADMRLSYQLNETATLTLAGVNLLDSAFPEDGNLFITGTLVSQTQRAFYGMLQLRY